MTYYLYNSGSELNETTGWYEMFFRGYDAALGRMLQVDPKAVSFSSHSTYNYAMNNPVMMNDPMGGRPELVGGDENYYTWEMPDGSLELTKTFRLSWDGWVDENGYVVDVDAMDNYYTYRDAYNNEMAWFKDRVEKGYGGSAPSSGKSTNTIIMEAWNATPWGTDYLYVYNNGNLVSRVSLNPLIAYDDNAGSNKDQMIASACDKCLYATEGDPPKKQSEWSKAWNGYLMNGEKSSDSTMVRDLA